MQFAANCSRRLEIFVANQNIKIQKIKLIKKIAKIIILVGVIFANICYHNSSKKYNSLHYNSKYQTIKFKKGELILKIIKMSFFFMIFLNIYININIKKSFTFILIYFLKRFTS